MNKEVGPPVLDLNTFKQISDFNWDAIVFADLEGKVLYNNTAAEKLYGYGPGELIGKNVDIFNAQVSHDTGDIVEAIMKEGGWSGEIIQIRKNKEKFTALLTVSLVHDESGKPLGLASNSKDVTEKKLVEERLNSSLKERGILLNEIHHRVKNNLAIISSLMQLQIFSTDNVSVIEMLQSSQSRIMSASLIHELLYQNESLSSVNLNEYASNLINDIQRTYGKDTKFNEFELSIAPTMELDIKEALPIGLILNEVITNSFKHAFDDETQIGKVKLSAEQEKDFRLIEISDNGKGLDENFDFSSTKSTGFSLIKTLVKQLKGDVLFESAQPGTSVIIKIPNNN